MSSELKAFLTSAQAQVEQALRAVIAPPASDAIPNLDDAMAYALGLDPDAPNAGKRIRPVLCLLVCHCLSGKTEPALPFAAAIELMHNFCLVHDDIEDGDEFRRGRPAAWKKYGLAHAINMGDYLFTKLVVALSARCEGVSAEKQVRLFQLMADTLDHTHRGQALDINARNVKITISHYMRLVTEKTGYYLAAPMIAGAIVADGGPEVEQALSRFGLSIGPMFQIRDDVIDLTHGKGRDSIGCDIREGKRSFLVAHVLENGPEELKTELIQILDEPREHTTSGDVDRAIEIFKLTGAFAAAESISEMLKLEAQRAIEPLPGNLRDWLQQITDMLAARQT